MQFKITFEAPTYSTALAIAGFIKEHRAVSDLDMVELNVARPAVQPIIQFSATRLHEDGRLSVVKDDDPAKTHYSLVVIHVTGGLTQAVPVENFSIKGERLTWGAKAEALHRAAQLSIELGYPIKAV